MADKLVELLKSITENEYLIIILVSMFPLIELKGAIPIGAKLGLGLFQTAPLAYLGSTLICIPIFFLLVPIFNLLKKIAGIRKIIFRVETVFKNKAQKIANKASGDPDANIKKIYIISLLVFVAVPFPVTGVWTGTAIAVFLGLKFKESIIPLAVGNIIAGTLITIMTIIFGDYVDIIIYVLFAIAIIMLIVFIVKLCVEKPIKPNESIANDGSVASDQNSDNNNNKIN